MGDIGGTASLWGIQCPQRNTKCALLKGLAGALNVADDILVYGEGNTRKEETAVEHDRRFIALMERCFQRQLKLNPN